MRQIKFRGLRVGGKGWAYGSLINCMNGVFILDESTDLELRPEYHQQGMGCGIEDRNIINRYDAAEFGWDRCIDRFEQCLPEYIEVIPETVGQFWKRGQHEFYGGDLFYAEASPSGSNEKRRMLCMVQDAEDGMQVVVWHEGEWWHYGSLNLVNIERVGNIHENPELLQK